MYTRILKTTLRHDFFHGKAIVIVGARQTGKTTLALDSITSFVKTTQHFNCDDPTDREVLAHKDLAFLKKTVGTKKIIFIDEAQKVDNIGQTIKLLVDYYKTKKQIILTGSSSFNLLSSVHETLTGRKKIYTLYPLSFEEMYPQRDYLDLRKHLEEILIYGTYPEVAHSSSFDEKRALLKEITESYLFKDILEFQKIKNPLLLRNLVKALALQIGSEVSYAELANLLGVDKNTIERYIDLLEKNFVIFRLSPYTNNKRREIAKMKKIYFFDNGIRNAMINNFNLLDSRNDVGALWEQCMITERMKFREYHRVYSDQYFWRTYDGSEIDLVEEREGKLFGYEFKWTPRSTHTRIPQGWKEYANSSYTEISRDTMDEFVFAK